MGQASQPVISVNYGAGKGERIRQILKYALGTAAFFSILWTALSLMVPNVFIRIFMAPTVGGGVDSIWLAMPITEMLVAVYAVYEIVKLTKQLNVEREVRYEQDHYNQP